MAQYPPEEYSSERLRESLSLLAKEIENIQYKPAYDEAQRMFSVEGTTTIVNDETFRLKFLRAEQFRPREAAERMLRNIDLLYRYIGRKGLRRPITMSDLDENSLAILKTGSFQLLPSRDRSGRRIAVRIGPFGLDFNKNEKSVSLTFYVAAN